MRIFRRNTEAMTHYQRVKRNAARDMTLLGTISAMITVGSLFIGNFAVVLFLAGISVAFFLVGYQQRIDAIASDDEVSSRSEQNGEQDT